MNESRNRFFSALRKSATHDHRALDVFDRVIEMEDGRIGAGHKPLLPA